MNTGFKKVDRRMLNDLTKKVNRGLKYVKTGNVTDANKWLKSNEQYINRVNPGRKEESEEISKE